MAVSEIAKFAWGLSGSDRSYRLKGRHAVAPEARRAAARAILFLHTKLEYQWSVQPEINLLWLLLPAVYLLLWIAALWGGFVSRLSDVRVTQASSAINRRGIFDKSWCALVEDHGIEAEIVLRPGSSGVRPVTSARRTNFRSFGSWTPRLMGSEGVGFSA